MDWSCTTLHSHNSDRVQWIPVFSTNLKSSNLLLFGILGQDLRKFAPNDRNWLISKVILLYASLIELISRNFSKMLQKKIVKQKYLNIHTVVVKVIFVQYTVWKNEKFGLTEKIFRQINSLVICLVKTLLSRNFCQKSVRLNFYDFHTVVHVHTQEFSTLCFRRRACGNVTKISWN